MRTVVALACAGLIGLTVPALADAPSEQVRISLDRYDKLMRGANGSGPMPTWAKGTMTVHLPSSDGDPFARVEVAATVKTAGSGMVEVPLLPAELIIEEATFNGNAGTMLRRAGVQIALLPADRSTHVRLRYIVPLKPSSDRAATILAPLPPLPSADLTVNAGDDHTPVDIWPGARTSRTGSTLKASIPATPAVVVRWGHGAMGSVVRQVGYALTLDESGDGVDVEATYDVRLESSLASIRIAHDLAALLGVTEGGKDVPTAVVGGWHKVTLKGSGSHKVVARFRLLIDRSEGEPQVLLSLDRTPITTVQVTIPGERTVKFDPAVPAVTELADEGTDKARTVARVALPPSEEVTISWTEVRAAPEKVLHVNSETYQLVTLDPGSIRSNVYIHYNIARGKAKELKIAFPDGVSVTDVRGEGIQWGTFSETADVPRHVRVKLGQERSGAFQLELTLQGKAPSDQGTPIKVPLVYPLKASPNDYHVGVVALLDGDKVGFEQVEPQGYTHVGEEKLPVEIRKGLKGKVNQAFSHVGVPAQFATSVTTEKQRQLSYYAHARTLYLIKESLLTGRSSIMVDVKSGRIEELVVSLPVEAKNVQFQYTDKNKEPTEAAGEGGRKLYTLRFTRALEGNVEITVHFEQHVDAKSKTVVLPAVQLPGADVEDGQFGIAAVEGVEVTVPDIPDSLRAVDVKELLRVIVGQSKREVLFGYKYPRGPWDLTLNITRHRPAPTPAAVIDAAWLETIVFEDGGRFTRAIFQVQNQSLIHLRFDTPENFVPDLFLVNGQKVRAGRTGKVLAIPIPKGDSVPVVVQYEEAAAADVGLMGSLTLNALKAAGVKIRNIQWLVHRPPELTIWGSDTDMAEASASDYVAPGHLLPPASQLPLRPDRLSDFDTHLFRLDSRAADEDALAIELSYVSSPGAWLGIAFLFIAIILLLSLIRRRVMQQRLGAPGVLALIVAVALVALKMLAWGLSPVEAIVSVVVLVGGGVFTVLLRRRNEGSGPQADGVAQ